MREFLKLCVASKAKLLGMLALIAMAIPARAQDTPVLEQLAAHNVVGDLPSADTARKTQRHRYLGRRSRLRGCEMLQSGAGKDLQPATFRSTLTLLKGQGHR